MTLWKCSTNKIQWNNVTSDNKSPRWHIYTCIHAVKHTVTFAQYLPREREGGMKGWSAGAGQVRNEMNVCHTQPSILDHNGGYFFSMMDRWAYQLWALMTPVSTPFAFWSPQVFIGCCSVNESSGLNMSEVFSFKSVSTFPDSFLNLQCHIQMLARQREFVMCHWCSLISLFLSSCTYLPSYLLLLPLSFGLE